MQGVSQGLEDEDTHQHMWAQCRSTGPGHWARPHTWWRWSRVACSLDCIQTVPPYRCQSRSLSAFQTVAQGPSYTERHLSGAQLEKGRRGRERQSVVSGCGSQKDNRRRRDGKTGRQREMVKSLWISSQNISHSCLLCQDRLFDSTSFCLLCSARLCPATANGMLLNSPLCDVRKDKVS